MAYVELQLLPAEPDAKITAKRIAKSCALLTFSVFLKGRLN
jgi:hypothetical protein